MSTVSTDGCSELTCPYHGAENRRKRAVLLDLIRTEANSGERRSAIVPTENLRGLWG